MADAMPPPAETVTRKLLNRVSDLMESEDGSSAAKTLVDAVDGIGTEKRADVWTVPKNLLAVQTLSKHIIHFMMMY